MEEILEETEITLINEDSQTNKVRTSSVRSKVSSIQEEEEESLENLGKIRMITPRPSLTHLPRTASQEEQQLDVVTEVVRKTAKTQHSKVKK